MGHHAVVYAVTIFIIVMLLFSFMAYLYDAYSAGTDTAYFLAFCGVMSLVPGFLYFNGVLNAAGGH